MCTIPVFAQENRIEIQIRKSFEKAETKTKSAEANFTFPDEIDESFNVSGALGLKIPLKNDRTSLFVNGEWNRNTLIDKEQNNYSFGVDAQASTISSNLIQHTFTITGKYNNDLEKQVEGGKFKLLYTPLLSNIADLELPYWIIPATGGASADIGNGTFAISHNIEGGIEYQNNVSSPSDSLNGSIGRLYGAYDLSFYPLAHEKLLDKNLYLNFSIAYRQEYLNSTLTELSNNPTLINFSVNYIVAKDSNDGERASLSLARVDGKDPWTGLENQSFWKFTIKVKI